MRHFKWCTKIMFDLRVKYHSERCTDQGIQTRSVTKKSQRETPLQMSFQFSFEKAHEHPSTLWWSHLRWPFVLPGGFDMWCQVLIPSGMQIPLKLVYVGVMSQSRRKSKRPQFCQCFHTSRSGLNLAHYIGHLMAMAAMWDHKSNICETANLKEL